MDRTRIRWRNVGRLAGGLAAGAALIAVVPGLLEPGAPAPLPPDVGLETDTSGTLAYAGKPAGGRERRERPRPAERPEHRRRDRSRPNRQSRPDRPPPHVETRAPAPAAPAPVPPPADPPPAPAAPPPPSTPPPPQPSVPPPTPPPPDHVTAEYGAVPTHAQTQSAPSQFGFEH